MAIINYDGISGISSITATGSTVQFYNASGIGSMVINPAGNALAGISSISTNVITASQYNITTYVPIQNGTFPTSGGGGTVSGTFTLPVKSNCLFSFSGTGYKVSGNIITMTLSITGIGNLTSISYSTNELASHKSSPTGNATATLSAGTYTVVITCDSNTDYNDKGNCALIAIPTL